MMRRSRSESLGNRRRRRAVGAGSLAASMLAVGVLGTSTAAYGATGHTTLTEIDYYTPGLPQWAAFDWLFKQYDKTHPNITIDRQTVAGSSLLPKELALASTHSLPDLAIADPTYTPSLVATGQWLNIKPDLTKWGQMSSYLPSRVAPADLQGWHLWHPRRDQRPGFHLQQEDLRRSRHHQRANNMGPNAE